ncbi:MAG: 4'-phosphopantetheinyl transferase [Candidatus Hodarchaeota archaeon]
MPNNAHHWLGYSNPDKQRIYSSKLVLKGTEQTYKAGMCICHAPSSADYFNFLKYLHPQELDYYKTLPVEKRKRSFSLGRYSAKKALSALTGESDLQCTLIERGLFNHPVLVNPNHQNIQVSISHCDDIGVALAFPEALPMGIDVEKVDPDKNKVLESQMTEKEKELIKSTPCSYSTLLVVLWTAKEALSKVLKTGLMSPFTISEISSLTVGQGTMVCNFRNFAQYKGIAFNLGCYMHTIVYPKSTEIQFNLNGLKDTFDYMESPDEQNIGINRRLF